MFARARRSDDVSAFPYSPQPTTDTRAERRTMSRQIPAHLNPDNNPKRERELRDAQKILLDRNARMKAQMEEGKSLFPGGADWDDFLARIARIRRQILDWNSPAGETSDFMLQFQTLLAEARGRVVRRTCIEMQAIAETSEEELDRMTEQERVEHFEVISKWEQHKEQLLGELPIEERKRIEGE
jgi:hypothetical protein